MSKWKIEFAGEIYETVGEIVLTEANEWESILASGLAWDCWEDLTERIADRPEGGEWDGWRWTPA